MPYIGRKQLLDKWQYYSKENVYAPFDYEQSLAVETENQQGAHIDRVLLRNYTDNEFDRIFKVSYRLKQTMAGRTVEATASKKGIPHVDPKQLSELFSDDFPVKMGRIATLDADVKLLRELTMKNPRLVAEKIKTFRG